MSILDDDIDVTAILLDRVLRAIEQLALQVQTTPPPSVTMSPPDLSEIVMAVSGLRPSATADEIANAITARLAPSEDDRMAGILGELIGKLSDLDFRMKGSMPAFGASGPSNISDNPTRELGIVSIRGIDLDDITAATEGTLQEVRDGITVMETRLDYDVRTDGSPVYIGKNVNGTSTGAATWTVQKLTYDSSNRLTRAQVLEGAWDNRASLSW